MPSRQYPKGISIANHQRPRGRRRKFPRDIQSPRFLSNLPAPIEGGTPPTLFLIEWDLDGDTGGPVAPSDINIPGFTALAEKIGSTWRYISSPNFEAIADEAGATLGTEPYPQSIVRYKDVILVSAQNHGFVSRDGGKSFSLEYSGSSTTIFYDFDSRGKAWRYDSSRTPGGDGNDGSAVWMSPSGAKVDNDWMLMYEEEGSYFHGQGANAWTSTTGIACHPISPSIIAFTRVNFDNPEPNVSSAFIREVVVTVNGGNTWNTYRLPEQVSGDELLGESSPNAEIGFTPTGRLIVYHEFFQNVDPFDTYFYAHRMDSPYTDFIEPTVSVDDHLTGQFTFSTPMELAEDGSIWVTLVRDQPEGFPNNALVTFLYKSTDNGNSFEEVSNWLAFSSFGTTTFDMPGYAQDLWVDPDTRVSTVFFGSFYSADPDPANAPQPGDPYWDLLQVNGETGESQRDFWKRITSIENCIAGNCVMTRHRFDGT